MDALLWVAVAVIFAVAEIFTVTLFLLMFSAGALAAAASAAVGAPVPVQAAVFVAVSAVTLVAVRPKIRRRLGHGEPVSMGVEAMPGASAVVVEQVDADRGMVRIDGELWQARSLEKAGAFSPGELVRIVDIDGGAVTVWRDELAGLTDPGPSILR